MARAGQLWQYQMGLRKGVHVHDTVFFSFETAMAPCKYLMSMKYFPLTSML